MLHLAANVLSNILKIYYLLLFANNAHKIHAVPQMNIKPTAPTHSHWL